MLNAWIREKYIASIKWNSLAAIYYQTALTLYMIWLLQLVGTTNYGIVGTLFSLLYLLVNLLDFGFENSLAPHLQQILQNQATFRHNFLRPFLWQTILLLSIPFLTLAFHQKMDLWFSGQFQCCLVSAKTWLILGALVWTEGIFKNLRSLAELLFLNRILAVIQSTTVTLYILLMFLIYWLQGATISFTLIFLPLLVSSVVGIIWLSITLLKIYRQLPVTSATITIKLAIFHPTRLWSYLNQVSRLTTGGNFLIVLFAHLFGASAVGPLKLANRIAVYLKYIITHGIGATTRSLFSQLKAHDQNRYENFGLLHQNVFYGLSGFFILGGATLIGIALTYSSGLQLLLQRDALLFLALLLFDNLLVIHEQFLLVEEKLYLLAIPNLTGTILLYGLAYLLAPSLYILVVSLVFIRLAIFIFVHTIIKKKVEKKQQSV